MSGGTFREIWRAYKGCKWRLLKTCEEWFYSRGLDR